MKPLSPDTRIALSRKFTPYIPLLGFITILLVIAVTGFQAFLKVEDLVVMDKIQDLDSIADLKVRQINDWKRLQIRRGESFNKSSFLPDLFGQWLQQGMPREGKEKILRFLAGLQQTNGYRAVTLYDKNGVVRLTTLENGYQYPDDVAMARAVMGNRQVSMSDFHMSGARSDEIRIDLAAPLIGMEGNGEHVMGAVVFQIDPHEFLYPLVAAWPFPSQSAETVLFRREGNGVLFLNDLRHRKGTALSLREPLTNTRLPAVMAVLGKTSSIDGIDYRGVAVVAAMRKVPDTPWFMVSKIDKAEFLAPVSKLKRWSITLGLVLAAIGSLLVFYWLRAYQTRYVYLKDQHDAALERELLVRNFELLTKHANDMILVADDTTRIVEANDRALETLGYTRDELLGMKVADLRDPALDLSYVNDRLAELLAKGELRVEENVRSKDGSILPVEISARVIEVQGQSYLQGILRDNTERRRAEEALRKSEAMLKEAQKMAHIGNWELDLVDNVLTWSDENYRIFEIDRARFGASYEAFLAAVHPEDRATVSKAYTDSVKNRTTYSIVHRLLFPEQRVKYVREWCETFYDRNGKPLRSIGTTQDITEHNKAEQEYQAILQATTDGFLVVDAHEGRFLDANFAYAGMTGYSLEELMNMRTTDVDAMETPEQASQHRKALRESGNARFETLLRRKDGGITDVEVSAHYLDIRGGIFIAFIRDITARKQAEAEQRKSAELIEDLYDNAPCGYHSLDTDGVIIHMNHTELKWLGYTADEIIGKMKIANLFTPRSREVFEKSFPRFKERGLVRDLEMELVCKDGRLITVLLSASGIYDAEGKFLMSRSTMFDISDRKLAEEKLFESEQRFRSMADNAPIIIWMANAGGGQAYTGCGFFNERWHEFTGLTLDESQGYNWISIIHPGDREHCLDVYIRAFEEVREFNLEYRLRRKDGVYRWIRDSGVPRFTAEGDFLGFIGTCIDITEQKLIEEMRAEVEHVGRLNIAGEMASGLAHELSQPLTAASNYLDGCLHRMETAEWDREKLRKAVKLAYLQTERAGTIINHLKAFIRKQGPERAMTDINELIKDSVDFLAHDISHQSIRVITCFSDLPQIMVNKIEIEQVLLNLMKNAIDSMASMPRRELRLSTCVVDSGNILVTVSDTGNGIPEADLERVFNPFQTSKQDGLGLGLAICRSLVESYGGRIWAEQNSDGGTEFSFTLPMESMSG